MILIPAIDIIDGTPVRLTQGDYDKKEVVAEDVLTTAESFAKAGAHFLHLVDLDGAKAGCPKNNDKIIEVAKNVNIPVEVGGGIRKVEDVEMYLENGISRVILGTSAVENPEFLKACLKKYGERIVVGIDAKNRIVKTAGWLEGENLDFIEFAKKMEELGVKTVIVTDISKDGTLQGPNIDMYRELQENVSMQIVASGGIHSLEDLVKLKEMNLAGAISGKALYNGAIDLKEALREIEGEPC